MDKPSQTEEQTLEFVGLPERPDPSTWSTEAPSEPVPDSTGGRDTQTDFVLLYA